MSDITLSFLVLGLVVVLFMTNRIPLGIVAIGAALALWATGILELGEALAGFGDPTVLFIASLFVVSEGLDATGVTAWAGQQLVERAGTRRTRLVVLMMLLVAALTALISVNGAVAALLPVVVVVAVRLEVRPSKLLIPLVFGAHAGSLLTLTGTPVHVLVSDAAQTASGQGFDFLEFGLVGVPMLAGGIILVVLFGDRLLPDRAPASIPPDLSRHARTLIEQYRLEDGAHRLSVRADSQLLGLPATAVNLFEYPGATLVGITTADTAGDSGMRTLSEGDLLMVRGEANVIGRIADELGLAPRGAEEDVAQTLFGRTSGLAEVVLPPRSPLIGSSVFPGMVTESGDLVILSVTRAGEELEGVSIELEAGDALLLQGTWDALDERLAAPEVLVVNSPEVVRRQAVPLGLRARTAILVLIGMVTLLVTGVVPAAVAGLLAACAMVLTGVLTPEGAYRGISWTTVVLVAGMIPMSTAMTKTGAADLIATELVGIVGPLGPYALLAGLFILTIVFSQLISNMATALIVIPIALSAAAELGLSARPIMMTITVAAAAAYLTPVATPVNTMVMGPAGYRFGDYWKLGLLFVALSFVLAVFLVPVIWPF